MLEKEKGRYIITILMIEDNSTISVFQKEEIPNSDWYTNDPSESYEDDATQASHINVKVESNLNDRKPRSWMSKEHLQHSQRLTMYYSTRRSRPTH